ncbi:hypothetical protein CVT25_003996 [Psilocybe cyanescens]|uniref:Uncharacterized protein n=1 Tax=Psilocybe cyanescens TaxID=93625 RepID=A0A409WXN7_PSICY|nr:hypothetical protein CVT25_003996 [Psilocybe cyanescens]
MSPNILDPSAIISLLPTLLPPNNKTLTSPQDAIAILVHGALTALAFRLTAIDESSTSATLSSNVLPTVWNKSAPGHYTFKYRHDQSGLEFVVKLTKLGTRTVINAIALESDRIATLDICTDDFTSPSFYPHNLDASDAPPLVHGYISSNRVSDLLSQLKLKIVQKLVPGLQKEGYTEEADSSAGASSSANPPPRDPTVPRPRPQTPPDAPDRNPYYPQSGFPRNPLEIGRRDLDPFPANPFAPPSLFPQHGGDGMFVGPEHPIFGMGRGSNSPLRGPWGGDGYLPPMGAPPGARFDPVGPGFPNRGLGPFGGNGRGRRPENPDNDEFMPPGMHPTPKAPEITLTTANTMNRSSSSPTMPVRRKNPILPGFRAPPRPNQRPIAQMTVRELQDRHNFNAKLLASPEASTSTYAQRVLAEQAEVESRLLELNGMEVINSGLRKTRIGDGGDMLVDVPREPPTSRTLAAKQKALSQFVSNTNNPSNHVGSLSMQEAIELERQAHLQDKERQERIAEKRRRLGYSVDGEVLTRQEREARVLAYFNHKPTESDMEDDDDDEDDDEDDDPASWFEDDQDDGRKGQDIVEPDVEDLSDIIRIDENKLRYGSFYEPRDDGD